MENVSNSAAVNEEVRGREESHPAGSRKQWGKLKDVMSRFEDRLIEVEISFKDSKDDMKSAINIVNGDMHKSLCELRDMIMGEMAYFGNKWKDGYHHYPNKWKKSVVTGLFGNELSQGPVTSGGIVTNHVPRVVDRPKPSPFVGKREARAVDDFLWEMKQSFKGVGIVDDATKIETATRYLKDTMALWWRRRHSDVKRGTMNPNTCETP